MHPRWDTDERGQGVADASRLLPDARALLEAMAEPLWVAEQPEAHLLPHIRRLAEDVPVDVVDARVDEDGVLVVELRWTEEANRQAAVCAGFALIGSFAEEMTYISMDETAGEIVLETVTGVVSEGQFAPHGHTVRLRVVGSS